MEVAWTVVGLNHVLSILQSRDFQQTNHKLHYIFEVASSNQAVGCQVALALNNSSNNNDHI